MIRVDSGVKILSLSILLLAALVLTSCDSLFVNDGNNSRGIGDHSGYFYTADNEAFRIVMLDPNLREIGSWSTIPLLDSVRVQGMTFDGSKIWISSAGANDIIAQVDLTGDSLVVLKSFEAPPTSQGTIRDITWDGSNLWAVNSGSVTYSFPPTLYKLDPTNGAILEEYPMPTPEPRALAYVGPNGDAYNRGADEGLYYAETSYDQIIYFNPDKQIFDTAFAAPIPPRGAWTIFPVGLCFDSTDFWLVNSSSAGDHLYRLSYTGLELERVELNYTTPGPLVWSDFNAMTANPPTVIGATPNSGAGGTAFPVTVIGTDFRPGAGLDVSFGDGITVSGVTFVDGSNLLVDIDIAADADIDTRDITVTNPDGKAGTGTALFTVLEIDPLAGYLWAANSQNDQLYKIRIIDTTVVQTWDLNVVAPGGSPQGLSSDGASLWLSAGGNDDLVIKLDTDDMTLSALSAVVAPPAALGIVRELAFNGPDLWVANSGTDSIYQIDPLSGNILDSIATPGGEIRGLAFANDSLYCADRTLDSVYVYDFGSDTWTGLFGTPVPPGGTTGNRYVTGMTFDGVNFWMCNSTYEFDYLFQVSLDGVVLRTYPAPLQGDATWTGVAFTQD